MGVIDTHLHSIFSEKKNRNSSRFFEGGDILLMTEHGISLYVNHRGNKVISVPGKW